jgi:uncharacterized protein YcfJ
MSKPAVFGIVDNESQARNAVADLEAAGFTSADISVLTRSCHETAKQSRGPLISESGETIDAKTRNVGHTNSTKAPEGGVTGGITGGAVGALAGWLVGIGGLAIPGIGPFVAAGPMLVALSGAAIGAAAGGVVGGLIGYGIPEFEAKIYADKVSRGHILIGIHAVNADEASTAKKTLESVGAHDLKITSEVAE